MQKKQTILVVASLLVVVLSVTLAYFTAQIIGKGKDVSVSSADLKIIFTDSDGAISGSNIEPGWSDTKTFTIENNSKSEYKYNIVIQDLLNTFVTNGYLQYKITSTNDGYNMTEFKDVPKSSVATDTILAYSVVIPNGVTQIYTIEFKYANDESVDQSEDMGKTLSGKLFITEGTEGTVTLLSQLLADKSTVLTRTDYSTVLTNDNTKTLYTSTEDSKTVYYFAGNATDNWVKFGKNASNQDLYWRIIRTNSDGGVRLLYHGTSTTATDAYIGTSTFNSSYNNIAYVSYMYGNLGSVANARENTTDSTIKTIIDKWYKDNLNTNYGKYLSTTAVYCNDRSTSDNAYFGAYTRLITNKTPSYDCTATEDKFTVDTSTGNGKLTYPIALMTADEVSFAGGLYLTSAPTWYYYNSANKSSTGSTDWWLLSPFNWFGSDARVFRVRGSSGPGGLDYRNVGDTNGVRPVISLKSCIKYSTGNGSASDPYTIKETTSGC
jgi:predicted lipoprotein with Yx(FWY)xxD motif